MASIRKLGRQAKKDIKRNERGSELIEMALCFPLLLMVVLGIVDFGFLFQRYEVVTNAAREGARVAVLPGYSTADIQSRVDSYATAGGLPIAPTVGVTDSSITAGGDDMAGQDRHRLVSASIHVSRWYRRLVWRVVYVRHGDGGVDDEDRAFDSVGDHGVVVGQRKADTLKSKECRRRLRS